MTSTAPEVDETSVTHITMTQCKNPGIADHILTISPGRWMALPGMEFKDYHDKRAPAKAVAKYYLDYVKKNNLTPFMASRSTVTMIQPLYKSRRRARWKVWVTSENNSTISYECRHLVLATGASDKTGCLGVAGELFPFVFHDLKSFEEYLSSAQEETSSFYKPNAVSVNGIDSAETPRLAQWKTEKSNGQSFTNIIKTSDARPKHLSESETAFKGFRDKELGLSNGIVKLIDVQRLNDIQRDDYSNEYKKLSRLKTPENDIWFSNEPLKEKELDLSLNELELNGDSGVDSAGRNLSVQDGKDEEEEEEEDEEEEGEKENKKKVLVVGAGLTAVDAILVAWNKNYSVVHAFRSPLTTAHLPAAMYPEYHELCMLMQGSASRKDYHPLPGYQVTEIHKDNSVQVVGSMGNKKTLKVFSVAVLIGSRPDLFFLPATLKNLGIDPNKPVDCKVNPVQIDPFSYRCVRAPPGLYALGPLVGDNFVRFLQGGAIAIAGHIFKDNSLHTSL